jgi:hypothetical protein
MPAMLEGGPARLVQEGGVPVATGDTAIDDQDVFDLIDAAARLLAERFAPPLLLAQKATRRLTETLARLGISGGAVNDALVAMAAANADA